MATGNISGANAGTNEDPGFGHTDLGRCHPWGAGPRLGCRHAMSDGGTRAHLEEPAVSRAERSLTAAGGGLCGLRS
jgi:hypothetical protein